jgi:hypothetical protein
VRGIRDVRFKTLQLHPDAPVLPGVTDRPGFKELLVADVSDAIEAKRPSIFALNNTMQILLPIVIISLTARKFSKCWKSVRTR